jgi:hypothetical protein
VRERKTRGRATAFLLERRWPNECGRVDARPQSEPEQRKRINVAFVVDTKGKSLEEVASFHVLTTEQAMPEPEPERELTAGELFEGNLGKLGSFVGDVPLTN